jgi:hypothetical protein
LKFVCQASLQNVCGKDLFSVSDLDQESSFHSINEAQARAGPGTPAFNAKVALAAISGDRTIASFVICQPLHMMFLPR